MKTTGRRGQGLVVGLFVGAFVWAGCDGERVPAPKEAPERAAPEVEKKKAPEVVAEDASPPGSRRQTFHGGMLSVEVGGGVVGTPSLVKTDTNWKSTQSWAGQGAVVSFTVDEGLLGGAQNEYDAGAIAFMERGQRKNAAEIIEEGSIELPGLGTSARHFRAKNEEGKLSHTALFTPDPYTMAMVVVLERQPMSTAAFTKLLRSVRVEEARKRAVEAPEAVTPGEIDDFYEKVAARGGESAEDIANLPTSKKPGAPSVANSCNLMTRQCYETAHSSVGSGYYSDAKKCKLGSFAQARPCPGEERVGYCSLNPQQLISFYESEGRTLAEMKTLCEGTYRGKWLGMPGERPWPRNAK